ncbi:MAG TPA: F0F1 ATP synthase subunit epsilon [Coxiellaceae bacterium]|nr:F0F1 ATP synthase subunit epsilon [Coxiellaceae bacterium]
MATDTTVINLDIVSAEAPVFEGKVQRVEVTGELGELGIHPGHLPLLTSLKPGQLKAIMENGEEMVFYLSGGMLEVQPQVITVLADTAARAEDLDEAAAQLAKEAAEKALKGKEEKIEYAQASAELAEAIAQLRAIKTLRSRHK